MGTQYEKFTTPLQGEQFRLVTLYRGSSSDKIQCSIETRALSDNPPYHALSYCWGNDDILKSIFINSLEFPIRPIEFPIRPNLYDALVRLRKPDEDLTIWIDLLCIHQSDVEEKQRQVDLMHRIYGQAESIIAWLGEHQADSESLFDKRELMNFDYHPGAALKAFLSRDYWFRAWIVQELLAQPKHVRLRCGSDEMLLSDFCCRTDTIQTVLTINLIDTNRNEQTKFSNPYEIPKRISMFLSSITSDQNGGLTLSKFLDSFLDSRCSNSCDNLFAFKHLFEPALQRTMAVNYSQSPKEIIIPQVFMAMIEETKSLHILLIRARQMLPRGSHNNWQKQLPTWCPFVGVPYKVPVSSGSDTREAMPNMPISGTGDKGLLHTKGVILGKVFQVQRSSSPGIFKKFENYKDHLKARNKVWEYIQFIAWGSSKQRNRRKSSLSEGIFKAVETKYRKNKYYQFFARGPSKQNNRLETAVEKINQLASLHNDSCPMAFGSVSDRSVSDGSEKFDHKLNSELQKFAYFTFAQAICSFKWEKSLHNQCANVPQNGVTLDHALSPNTARRGDVICAICGCETPVLLRSVGKHYQVLGEVSICNIDCCQVLSQCNVPGDLILC